jgi:hypothetical protein
MPLVLCVLCTTSSVCTIFLHPEGSRRRSIRQRGEVPQPSLLSEGEKGLKGVYECLLWPSPPRDCPATTRAYYNSCAWTIERYSVSGVDGGKVDYSPAWCDGVDSKSAVSGKAVGTGTTGKTLGGAVWVRQRQGRGTGGGRGPRAS